MNENDLRRRPDPRLGVEAVPPMAPAVANAVRGAVGIRLTELPMTPPRVLAALLAAMG